MACDGSMHRVLRVHLQQLGEITRADEQRGAAFAQPARTPPNIIGRPLIAERVKRGVHCCVHRAVVQLGEPPSHLEVLLVLLRRLPQ